MDPNMVMMALELLLAEHMEADILPIRHHMEEQEIMVAVTCTVDTPAASTMEQDIFLGIIS